MCRVGDSSATTGRRTPSCGGLSWLQAAVGSISFYLAFSLYSVANPLSARLAHELFTLWASLA